MEKQLRTNTPFPYASTQLSRSIAKQQQNAAVEAGARQRGPGIWAHIYTCLLLILNEGSATCYGNGIQAWCDSRKLVEEQQDSQRLGR